MCSERIPEDDNLESRSKRFKGRNREIINHRDTSIRPSPGISLANLSGAKFGALHAHKTKSALTHSKLKTHSLSPAFPPENLC